MKHRWFTLVLALTALASRAETAADKAAVKRDAAGFLPVADAATEPLAASPRAADSQRATPSAAPTSEPGVVVNYVLDDRHKLIAGDRVSFEIKEDRTNAMPLIVAESAELDVPYIGRVSVAGKTCKQAAAEVKAALDKDYYFNSTVIIGLDQLSSRLGTVYVFGPVMKPGPVPVPAGESFTVRKAILLAGGFGDFAKKTEVQVIRKTPEGNVTLKVNMKNVMEKGKIEEDIALEPEDFIIVPQSKFSW